MNKAFKVIPVGITSAIVVAGIAYFSLWPDPMNGMRLHLFPHSDKVFHGLMYFTATIAFLIDYATHRLPHHTKFNHECALTATAMIIGLIMEILQLAMQVGRGYDNMDIAANCTGALLGLLLMKWKGIKTYRHAMLNTRRHHHKHHHHTSE